MALRRDWSDAIAFWAGVPCVHCGRWPRELAHTIGREYDERRGVRRNVAYVHPLSVVPLCQKVHREYDQHRFDLFPYLTEKQVEWAVNRVGRGNALRRIRTRAVFHQELTSSYKEEPNDDDT